MLRAGRNTDSCLCCTNTNKHLRTCRMYPWRLRKNKGYYSFCNTGLIYSCFAARCRKQAAYYATPRHGRGAHLKLVPSCQGCVGMVKRHRSSYHMAETGQDSRKYLASWCTRKPYRLVVENKLFMTSCRDCGIHCGSATGYRQSLVMV